MVRLARHLLAAGALLLAIAGPAAAAPVITVEPGGMFFFSPVELGAAELVEFAVVNEGTSAGTIGTPTVTGDPAISIDLDDCAGLTLDPNEFCSVYVLFEPTVVGIASADLSVPSDAPGAPAGVLMFGEGTSVLLLRVDPSPVDVGPVRSGQIALKSFEVLRLRSVDSVEMEVDGPDASAFQVMPDCPEPSVLETRCGGTVRFRPTRVGLHTATVTIKGGGYTARAAVTGTGESNAPLRPPRPPRLPRPPVVPPAPTPPDEHEIQFSLSEALDAQVAQWRKRGRRTFSSTRRFILIAPQIASTGTLRMAIHTTRGRKRLVAEGEIEYSGSGRPRVEAQLTRTGRALLREKRSRRLAVTLSFRPPGRATVKVVLPFRLKG